MEKLYTASVTAKGGRNGHIKSSDGTIEFDVRKPREIGGQGGATNPEQLFAAAWGPCYLGVLETIAEREGIDVSDASVEVHVSLNQEGSSSLLSADLDVHIPGIAIAEAQKLADKATQACPYAKVTKGNMQTRVIAI